MDTPLSIAPQPLDSYLPPDYQVQSSLDTPQATGGTGGDGVSSFLNDVNTFFTQSGQLINSVFDPSGTGSGSLFNVSVSPDTQTQAAINTANNTIKYVAIGIGILILVLLFRK